MKNYTIPTTYYSNKLLIPVQKESIFTNSRRTDLSILELYGLKTIATYFFLEYEEEQFGKVSTDRLFEIQGYLRGLDDGVDILDGYYDTYEFDGYLFSKLWVTDNGVIMLSAYKIPESCEDWTTEDYAEFETVLFRLN